MDNNKSITFLIESLLPDHVRASYPRLVEFAKAFFEYLETQNKSSYYQNTLYLQRDIRVQDPEFAEYIKRELGILTTSEYALDPELFYDNVVDIWKSKGSEESVKTFFRIFLNDEVEVFYPWESVLIPSDGRWIVDTVIRVSPILGNPENFVGKRIFQVGTNAEAVVDSVERKVYSDGIIFELKLIRETITGTFFERNTIYADETLTAEVYRSVTGLAVTEPGTGYKIGDKITLNGYVGTTFVGYVDSVDSDGGIISVALADFGAGNTPLSVINNFTTEEYYLIDFIFYDFTESLGLITQVGEAPFVNYGLITDAATLANDYGSLTPPPLVFNIKTEGRCGAGLDVKYGHIATCQG